MLLKLYVPAIVLLTFFIASTILLLIVVVDKLVIFQRIQITNQNETSSLIIWFAVSGKIVRLNLIFSIITKKKSETLVFNIGVICINCFHILMYRYIFFVIQ